MASPITGTRSDAAVISWADACGVEFAEGEDKIPILASSVVIALIRHDKED